MLAIGHTTGRCLLPRHPKSLFGSCVSKSYLYRAEQLQRVAFLEQKVNVSEWKLNRWS